MAAVCVENMPKNTGSLSESGTISTWLGVIQDTLPNMLYN